MQKLYANKSGANQALLSLCQEVCDSIRAMVGERRYRFLAVHVPDNAEYYIRERQEYYVVGTASLIYGSGSAFIHLAKNGLERESIQMQRHVMEYYFLARYYSENPKWAFIHWVQSIRDDATFSESVIAHHGSRQDLDDKKRDAKIAESLLAGIPKSEGNLIRPSVEILARKYALRESDYTMLYRWPSQITHASFLGLKYAWMKDNTPRFDSEILGINSRAAMVTEYLISYIEAIQATITCEVKPDIKVLKSRLRKIRTELNIQTGAGTTSKRRPERTLPKNSSKQS